MSPSAYLNFDLLILRSADGYAARVISSPVGEATGEFQLPFADDVLAPFFDVTGRKTRHGRASRQPITVEAPLDVKVLGQQLYATVFASEIGKCLLLSLQKAQEQQAHLRIRLRLDKNAPELAEIPWEYLYAPDWENFPALSEETPIIRYIEQMRSVEPLHVTLPLHILAVLASPQDVPPLEIDQEWKRLRNATKLLREHKQITLDKLKVGTLEALQDYLRSNEVHILHFIGHGFFDADSNRSGLIFATEANLSHEVSAAELATLLNSHKSMRLAFLNACEGARSGNEEYFAGAAQILVQQGIPAVIAMQFPVTDQAAITLSNTFYRAIADGLPVDAALTEARKSIFVQGNTWEWGTPVFFSRSPDNALFDIEDTLPTPACPYPGMVPFAEKDSSNFFGRDSEIKEAVEHLRLNPFLTVIGPSGSGKSSLVYAGMLPALRTSKRFGAGDWRVLIMRPGEQPLTELLKQFGAKSESDLLQSTSTQRTLLFVDQFEEAFTLARHANAANQESTRFLDILKQICGKANLFMILTVRADFYPDLMAVPLWALIKANRLELPPMGARELRTALVQPAEQVGITIEPLLVEHLINEAAGEPGVLPLVQETLVQLWEHLEKRRLPYSAYLAMADSGRSGLQVAIARRADVTFANLSEAKQVVARRIFLRLVQFGEGRADTRRQLTVAKLVDASDSADAFEETLQELAKSRLLTLSGGENQGLDQRSVDISHEALISGWPKMQDWLKQRREAEQVRRRLDSKAEDWLRLGKGEGGLLDQYELREAEQWLDNPNRAELGSSKLLLDLIAGSRSALKAAEAAKEATQKRELKQAQELLKRSWALVAMMGALLVGAIVAGWVIYNSLQDAKTQKGIAESNALEAEAQKKIAESNALEAEAQKNTAQSNAQEAEAQRKTAESNALEAEFNAREATANKFAAQAQSYLISNDTTTAMARSRDAVTTTLDKDGYIVSDADLALRRSIGLYAFRSTLPYYRHVGAVNTVVLSPNGKWIASGSDDHSVRLWEYPTGHHVRNFGNLENVVKTLAFSPDGKFLAAGGEGASVRIWNVVDGKELQTLKRQQKPITSVSFTSDSTLLLSASEDSTIIIWDTTTWQPIASNFSMQSRANAARFSPDGQQIAAVDSDGWLRLWDVESGQEKWAIQASNASLRSLVFSLDGKVLATAGVEKIISLWNADNGSQLFTLPAHEKPIQSLAMNHAGTLLVSASEDSTLKLWDLQTKALVQSFQGEEEDRKEFTSVLFSADETMLISGSRDRAVRIWNIQAGVEVNSLPGHVDAILSAAFSPDSATVVTVGRDEQIRFWDVASGETNKLIQTHEGNLHSVAYSPDGKRLVTAGERGLIHVWNTLTSTPVLTLTSHTDDVFAVVYAADGKQIVSSGADHTIRIWNAITGKEIRTIGLGGITARSISLSPDGAQIAAGCDDGVLRIWQSIAGEASADQEPIELIGHTKAIDSIAFSRDGTMVATASEDSSVRVWSVRDRVPLRIFQGHTERVLAVAFSPDGKRLASGGDDTNVRLWNVERGEAIRILFGHSDIIRSLAFSPDGNILVSTAGGKTGNNSIRLWNVKPLAERFKLEPHGSSVRWATFSPAGNYIATASDDGKIRLWDGESEALLKEINAHDGIVRTVAFSHDGRMLVSAGNDGLVKLWNVPAMTPIKQFAGHTAAVRSAFFSPDDKTILSASEDSSVRLWDVASENTLRSYEGNEAAVMFAAFSPDGQTVASVDFQGRLLWWPVQESQPPFVGTSDWGYHSDNVIAFSPDGHMLAVGARTSDSATEVRFWDVATGEPARQSLPFAGTVRGIAFSPDGEWLLAGGPGSPVQMWNLTASKVWRTFSEHDKSVWSVNFSADGQYFITGSDDRTARLWFTTIDQQIALANQLLQRDPPIFMPERRTHLTK